MRRPNALVGLTLVLTLLLLTTEGRLPQLARVILGVIAIVMGVVALFIEIKRARQA